MAHDVKDIFLEIVRLGIAHMNVALSGLIGEDLIPRLDNFSWNPEPFRKWNGTDMYIVSFSYRGPYSGKMFYIFPQKFLHILMEKCFPELGHQKKNREVQVSAFKELGNILASAFLNAMYQVTGKPFLPTVPELVPKEEFKERVIFTGQSRTLQLWSHIYIEINKENYHFMYLLEMDERELDSLQNILLAPA